MAIQEEGYGGKVGSNIVSFPDSAWDYIYSEIDGELHKAPELVHCRSMPIDISRMHRRRNT